MKRNNQQLLFSRHMSLVTLTHLWVDQSYRLYARRVLRLVLVDYRYLECCFLLFLAEMTDFRMSILLACHQSEFLRLGLVMYEQLELQEGLVHY